VFIVREREDTKAVKGEVDLEIWFFYYFIILLPWAFRKMLKK